MDYYKMGHFCPIKVNLFENSFLRPVHKAKSSLETNLMILGYPLIPSHV